MRIIVEVPEDQAIDYLRQVVRDLDNECTSGHVDADTHWDSQPDGADPEMTLPHGVTITRFVGDDGASVVQVDTTAGVPVHLRVNVNDAPVFDQDPEKYGPPIWVLVVHPLEVGGSLSTSIHPSWDAAVDRLRHDQDSDGDYVDLDGDELIYKLAELGVVASIDGLVKDWP
ncbi:hypothetical protein [Mycolicibacterium sphagni]|uniref:hypothetical protein n=1 Tax=Mycolicibacterium sphagni TaxID=1786 RepID=UPI0021F36599|nr:hypothetical protein [Mycolicibacterium sphagni]MCV7174826.1 hypothetical protein [Mycolicibacterium sphagni]